MSLPDFKHDFKDYQKFDIGAMGEFDVAVLIEQYAGKPPMKRLYPEWRGGYYYAAKSKTNSDPSAPLGLLYVSRWSGPDAAEQFAAIYARSLRDRYKKAEAVEDGMPDAPSSVDNSEKPLLKGRHVWNTEEGTIVIEQQKDTVFVSESLDAGTTAALEKEVFGKQGN
jgi:hypothetical protein